MKTNTTVLIILFSIVGQSPIMGQVSAEKLKVGDKPPPLTIQEWLKGEPIKEFKRGNLYVVEFSGTWCPPCRKVIPHLTDISKKYQGQVQVVSVYLENNNADDTTDLSYLEKVRHFIEGMRTKVGFSVGVDVPQKTTRSQWKVSGIPSAFVVDRSGNLAWIGHPVDLDVILGQILRNTFSPENAIASQKEIEKVYSKISREKESGNFQAALNGIDSLIIAHPNNKWFPYQKFVVLVGEDDEKAYQWVRYLLDSKIENFDWPHLLGEFDRISDANRNYKIELEAIDRTILESEAMYLAAFPASMKASTYSTLGQDDIAIEWCKKAIEYSKTSVGNSDETKRYESDLVLYKYKAIGRKDLQEANDWLKQMIESRNVVFNAKLVDTAIGLNNPNYVFIIELIDLILESEGANAIYFLGRKAKVYATMGNYTEAIKICKQVVEACNDKGIKDAAIEYENLIAEYTKKVKDN